MMQKIVAAHVKAVDNIKTWFKIPVILTSPVVRLYYQKIIKQFSSDSTVLSFNEIESDVQVQAIGSIAV